MKLSKVIHAVILACCAAMAGAVHFASAEARVPAQGSWTLETVLKQLDSQASDFQSLVADLERTKVTVVVNDKSTESGRIYVRRDNKMRMS